MNKKYGKRRKTKKKEIFETVILEQTIIKIGALLALGFGEAGSKIIADNMGHGDVDPMIPGTKIVAVFGFCDIRQFSEVTEVLQEDVMLFVNEVADIVHTMVDQFSGAANKNIGEAFLLVWKFNEDDVDYDEETNDLCLRKNNRVSAMADMSVVSFVKTIAMVRVSYKLNRYSKNKEILALMPNFRVNMGFGLHVGWAIEGAIGSDFKIDASYLSPNVNMSSRLEAATSQFGVPILVSGMLVRIMTARTVSYMRQIDCVTVKGSIEPVELWTVDLDITLLENEKEPKKQPSRQDKKMKKVRQRIQRNRFKEACFSNQIQVSEQFETDEHIRTMRSNFTSVSLPL